MSVETLKVQIIKKAWEDAAFKQLLLSDPKSAIKQAFGVELPEGIELKAVEETPSSYVLVVPPKPEDVLAAKSGLQYHWT